MNRKYINIFVSCAGIIALIFAIRILYMPRSKLAIIAGVVVPHHDIVKTERREIFAAIKRKFAQPKTIILVSPNHFNKGKGVIQTRASTFTLYDGTLEANSVVIEKLLRSGVVTEEPISFQNEHGIYTLLNDIKDFFPSAKLIPIIIKQNGTEKDVAALHDRLLAACADCLLIASVDFSHYQPALLADLHDKLALRGLQALDENILMNHAEVDSPQTLTLLSKWALSHNTPRFTIFKHTNSGIIINNPDVETTSHIFGWYEEGDRVKPQKVWTFLIGGNFVLNGSFSKALESMGERVFWGTDFHVAHFSLLQPHAIFVQKKLDRALAFLHIQNINHAPDQLGTITIEEKTYPDKIAQRMLLLAGEISLRGIKFFYIPIEFKSGAITFLKGDEKRRILDALYAPYEDFQYTTESGSMIQFGYAH